MVNHHQQQATATIHNLDMAHLPQTMQVLLNQTHTLLALPLLNRNRHPTDPPTLLHTPMQHLLKTIPLNKLTNLKGTLQVLLVRNLLNLLAVLVPLTLINPAQGPQIMAALQMLKPLPSQHHLITLKVLLSHLLLAVLHLQLLRRSRNINHLIPPIRNHRTPPQRVTRHLALLIRGIHLRAPVPTMVTLLTDNLVDIQGSLSTDRRNPVTNPDIKDLQLPKAPLQYRDSTDTITPNRHSKHSSVLIIVNTP